MKRYLVLQNGTVFEGEAFGAAAEGIGELVFTTGMNGYIETLTDPSYCGQIVLQTFPMIGNYGVIPADFEGKCHVRGYVVREWCERPSNFRSEKTLDEYLKEIGVPGICGIDTRAVTKLLREQGTMNAGIFDSVPTDLSAVADYAVTGAVETVTCDRPETISPDGDVKFRVALMDYGKKNNIERSLAARGCEVTVFPAATKAEEILAGGFDGVMLSNGPGDPADNTFEIGEIGKLMGKLPVFGICLGHQLMAIAQGGKTVKLKYGHRGVNQPVREAGSHRTFISSQNHGYAVVSDSVPGGRETFINANDGTCEGMSYDAMNAFSVQFHPEACAGPKDTAFLFDEFIKRMGGDR